MRLDLNAAEVALRAQWIGDSALFEDSIEWALIEECRALRTALRPFALQVGPQEGELFLMRKNRPDGATYFTMAQLSWNDLNRAVEILVGTPQP